MAQITPGDAVTLVRRNLDELELNGSIMYDTDTDNESLDNIIKRHLPDAINTVHLAAPVQLLEGEDSRSFIVDSEASKLADGQYLYEFSLDDDWQVGKFLRIVALQANDSPYVVTEVSSYASVAGRKQSNQYIRGRWDRPVLVRLPEAVTPRFRYYSLRTPSGRLSLLLIIWRQVFDESATNYYISPLLRDNIINCLTAKVLESFGDQRAQSYYQKAYSF